MKILFLIISMLMISQWGDATGINPLFFRPGRNNINNILRCPGPVPRASLTINEGRILVVPSCYSFTFPTGVPSLDTQIRLLNLLGPNYNPAIQTTQRMEGPVDVDLICNVEEVQANEERLDYNSFVGNILTRYEEEGLNNPNFAITITDVREAYNRTLNSIDCRVDFDWLDAGSQIFPRYYASGFCRGRRCSLPDRNNFLCRPDLTNRAQMRDLDAFQWDCCWTGPLRRDLTCGWRQFTIPLVCDCDCDCGAVEGVL